MSTATLALLSSATAATASSLSRNNGGQAAGADHMKASFPSCSRSSLAVSFSVGKIPFTRTPRTRIQCEVAIKSDSATSSSSSSADLSSSPSSSSSPEDEEAAAARIGARVRVKVPLKVYHVPRVPDIDLTGKEGELKQYVAVWKGKKISANLPYKVEFYTEVEGRGRVKFFAHLKDDEFEYLVKNMVPFG